jgi:kynurenine--oxoglutarate transaminase/cysteine-S-conjugate beta-lyase/glutamine--phenylpyruvate transaminase
MLRASLIRSLGCMMSSHSGAFKIPVENTSKKFDLPQKLQGNDKSVWVEYVALAQKYKPINLGQGFPDFQAPSNIREALAGVPVHDDWALNQYTRGFGHPRLVKALANLYSGALERSIEPEEEVLVTAGAYEALFASIQGHTNPGDEWIIIEPFFDCYEPMVRMAGGLPRFIPLKPKKSGPVTSADWVFDEQEMTNLFNSKTKGIIINTPHNPVGKVFTRKELEFLADLAKKWNVLVIADEVYEWMVYDDVEHIRIASLPDMYERTITIGSAGKTFSVTGWKIGWAYGPANLLKNLKVVHQNSVYTCATPIQEAVAIGFEQEIKKLGNEDCYFKSIAKELLPKREKIAKFLSDIGMVPTIPQGGYFMLADWQALAPLVDLSEEEDQYKDYKFTKFMTKSVGIQGIPPSAFYSEEHKHLGENLVRYCFIKSDKTLKDAEELLKGWKAGL